MITKTSGLSETAPTSPNVTPEDEQLGPLYVELLERLMAKQPWERIAKELLDADPAASRTAALARFESYKNRALWMRDEGCLQLLETETPEEAFKVWAAEILTKMIQQGDINYSEARPVDTWAKNKISELVEAGKLQPDPAMDRKQCARLLQKTLSTKH